MFVSQLAKWVDAFYRLKATTWQEHLQHLCSKLHIPMLAHIIEAILFTNCEIWEIEVSRFLANTKGDLFVDVGSCYGRYAILLGRNYKHIIAIEPEPQNMWVTRYNVNYAHLNNVEFYRCAVSDKDGHNNLYFGTRSDGYSICWSLRKEKIEVPTRTLSSILKEREADLVKVDAEGAEWLVLKGAEPVIDKVRSWLVELHDLRRKEEFEAWFISYGYFTRWIDSNHLYARK